MSISTKSGSTVPDEVTGDSAAGEDNMNSNNLNDNTIRHVPMMDSDDDDDDDDDSSWDSDSDDDDDDDSSWDSDSDDELEEVDNNDDSSSEGGDATSGGDDGDGDDEIEDIGHRYRYDNDQYRYSRKDDQSNNDQDRQWDQGEQERKERQRDFLLFIEFLVESIKDKAPVLYTRVNDIVEDCKRQHEQFHLRYENLTTSTRVAVKHLLCEESAIQYWEQAEADLKKSLEEKHLKMKQKTEDHDEHYSSASGGDWGFGGWGGMRGWRERKDFSLLTQILVCYMELQSQEQQGGGCEVAALFTKAQDILSEFKATNEAPVHQDEAQEKLKALLSDSGHWSRVEEWYKDIDEALGRLKSEATTIAKSHVETKSFLEALPSHPGMALILLNRGVKVILASDPVVPVVALLVQSNAEKSFFLHDAAISGASLDVIKYLTEKHPKALETPDVEGCLPLHGFLKHHKAMKKKKKKNALAIAEHFVDKAPASLSTPLPNGELALHLCFDLIEHMNDSPSAFQLASLFMERYPKALDLPGAFSDYTPLQHALYRKAPLDLLQRMVELAPNSSRTTAKKDGEYPMVTACEYGRLELARVLLTKGALRRRGTGWESLRWHDQTKVSHLKAFIEDCKDLLGPNEFKAWLYVQVRGSQGGALKKLLQHSPPDAVSWALNHRNKSGFLLVEIELAQCEASVNITDLSILIQQAPECLESKGPEFDQTPLHTAVTHDNKEAVASIINALRSNKLRALSQCDKYGRLPLHVAVMAGASLGLLKLLIESYPNALWTADTQGYTPLHHAFHVDPKKVGWWAPSCGCKKSRLSHAGIKYLLGVVKFLLREHAEDTRRALWMGDSYGRLPLHHAMVEDGRVVELLLREMGRSCRSSVDDAGRTVLHVALECQASPKTVEALLRHHDSLQLEKSDGQGRLPLLVACESGCPLDVVFLLLRRTPQAAQHLFTMMGSN